VSRKQVVAKKKHTHTVGVSEKHGITWIEYVTTQVSQTVKQAIIIVCVISADAQTINQQMQKM